MDQGTEWLTSKEAIAKEATAGILLFTSFIVAAVPRLISWKINPLIFSSLNCLAAGVVLGTAFIHMIPTATSSFHTYFENRDEGDVVKDYPWSLLISGLSLMALLSLDKLFTGAHSHDCEEPDERVKEVNHTVVVTTPIMAAEEKSHHTPKVGKSIHSAPSSLPNESTRLLGDITADKNHSECHEKNCEDPAVIVPKECNGTFTDHHHKLKHTHRDGHIHEHSHEIEHYHYEDIMGGEHQEHTIETSVDYFKHQKKEDKRAKLAQAYIFLCAISLHSLFEGMGLGAESQISAVFGMLLAVFSHKWLEAFALGCSLHYAGLSTRNLLVVLCLYSITTPIGILAGMIVGSATGQEYSLAAGILVSLASGSFLYISLIELIPSELKKPGGLKTKLLVTWLGWMFMAAMALNRNNVINNIMQAATRLPRFLSQRSIVRSNKVERGIAVHQTSSHSTNISPIARSFHSVTSHVSTTRLVRPHAVVGVRHSSTSQGFLRIGDTAPDFNVESSVGEFNLYKYLGNSWGVFFSHPADFTPVCTTELGMAARLLPEFEKRNTKVFALSVDPIDKHHRWIDDINETQNTKVTYPIVADADRKVATTYGMLDPTNLSKATGMPVTVRSVFIIDPKKTIRLILTYPASCGRNFHEVLRTLDSLQTTDRHSVATPVDWKKGDDLIVLASLSNDQAKEAFGEFKEVKPYLRYIKDSQLKQ
ncbi:anti-oxidant AhpCTSA family protein [Planoprotostelium fungivorum]|uniref:Anti-oxidant AhpCTSA family protein n=1 Tax=Planoprotostelium fungivorum TaxID=1890364 RepID=A0A2P6N6K2_9EUKA|nr:anti-oxidant AhpCTSA family protein [Planoprotostelium fungivorum]